RLQCRGHYPRDRAQAPYPLAAAQPDYQRPQVDAALPPTQSHPHQRAVSAGTLSQHQAMEKISHILIPVNGNPEDEVALMLAGGIAKRNKAKVTVVHVVEVQRALPVDAELPAETARGEKVLDGADEQSRHLDVNVTIELLQARQAGPAIIDEAS